jgi:hypothetical protein
VNPVQLIQATRAAKQIITSELGEGRRSSSIGAAQARLQIARERELHLPVVGAVFGLLIGGFGALALRR